MRKNCFEFTRKSNLLQKWRLQIGFEIKRYSKDVHCYDKKNKCNDKENDTCNMFEQDTWLLCLILFARITRQYSSTNFVLSCLEFRSITLDTESSSISSWCFQRLRHEYISFAVINSFSHLYWFSKCFQKCLLNNYGKWSGCPSDVRLFLCFMKVVFCITPSL